MRSTSSIKWAVVVATASAISMAGATAPRANAEPVSDHFSASPQIEAFWRGIEGRGFGYIDWQRVSFEVCPSALGMSMEDAITFYAAKHQFSNAEATAIVESAIFSLCVGLSPNYRYGDRY